MAGEDGHAPPNPIRAAPPAVARATRPAPRSPSPPTPPPCPQVYDVSSFVPSHPGGRVILAYAGKDATDAFAAFHAPSTWRSLKQFHVGDLVDADAAPPAGTLVADYRALRASLLARGAFKASLPYYAFKLATTAALGATALASLFAAGAAAAPLHTLLLAFASALTLGLFWQQCGWLAHDFCHQQVFANRKLNRAIALMVGNVWQGFSVAWWKHKHDQHHACPNELDGDTAAALDPDIDTLPLLAWSKEQMDAATGPRALLRRQHHYFVPLLLAARLTWAQQSVGAAVELATRGAGKEARGRGALEVFLLALHYAWTLGAAVAALGVGAGAAYVLAAQLLSGLLLSLVFVQSHNGMEVYSSVLDWMTAQAVSTRDVTSTLWSDWFTGGLNYQLEHHAFPTLPRHALGGVAADVRALCEKHGLAYESVSMPVATKRVLQHLADIAALA